MLNYKKAVNQMYSMVDSLPYSLFLITYYLFLIP